jgi:hypothetical protein
MGAANLDSLEYDWDAAIEIGSASQWDRVTLTRIGSTASSGDQPVFQEEIDAEKGTFPRSHRYLRGKSDEAVGAVACWMQWAVRVRLEILQQAGLDQDLTVVIAASNFPGWVLTAPMKKPNKKGELLETHPLWQPAGNDTEIISRIDQLEFELWETNDYQTSSISDPRIPYFEEARRNTTALWRFGIVEGLESVREALLTSPNVQKLLAMTENGTLAFWPTNVGNPIATHHKKLQPETQAAANGLMYHAVMLALAGGGSDTDRWSGKEVVGFVEEKYKELVFTYNKPEADHEASLRGIIKECTSLYQTHIRHGQAPRKRSSDRS